MEAESSLTMDPGSTEAHLKVLSGHLAELPSSQRAAFAAGMVERLLPFARELDRLNEISTAATLGAIVERLWLHVSGVALSPDEETQFTAECVDLDLGDDDAGISWMATVAASRAAVSALDIGINEADSVANAVEAAERVMEIVDHWIFNRPRQVFSAEPSSQSVIDPDPLMVAERMVQLGLLRLLVESGPLDADRVARFRSQLPSVRLE